MARQIYRGEALQRLASPEQLDQLMPLTDPRGWLALAALGMVLAAVLVWACFGTVRVTVEAQGVLVRPGGVRTVAAPRAGVVCQLPAQAGERVVAGQELCRLAPTGGAGCDQPVHSPIAARVLDIPVHEGEAVEPGAPLVTLESPEVAPQAVLYVPADTGYQVRPRMEARVEPAGSDPGGVGALSGRVVSAGRYPVSRSAIAGLLGDEWRADPAFRGSPLLEVVVGLTPGARAPGPGPTSGDLFPGLYSGTPCRATITVDRLRPLRLIVSGRSGRAGS